MDGSQKQAIGARVKKRRKEKGEDEQNAGHRIGDDGLVCLLKQWNIRCCSERRDFRRLVSICFILVITACCTGVSLQPDSHGRTTRRNGCLDFDLKFFADTISARVQLMIDAAHPKFSLVVP